LGRIRSVKLLVEDHYEVDPRYSVEECLEDKKQVYVIAGIRASGRQSLKEKEKEQPPKTAATGKDSKSTSKKEDKKEKKKQEKMLRE
jgi:hypothetical protein